MVEAVGTDPRVVRTHTTVLSAARELLLTKGWDQVTVANVADRSGYARSTLYRHWPNRLDLLRDAISEQARLTHTVPSGITRQDLIAELQAFVTAITTTGLGHMVAAMAHMARDDREWADLNEAVHGEGTRVLRAILAAVRDDRTVASRLSVDDAVAMLVGPIVHRFLFSGGTPDTRFVVALVDSLLVEPASEARGRDPSP